MGSAGQVGRGRWSRIGAVLATAALVVAACGTGDTDAEGDPGESPDAEHGGEVTYALEAETLDFCLPTAQLAIGGIIIATAVYDTLTIPDADGEMVPFLAESVEPNEDATTWTITLRDGIEFHNGEPLDAEAVVMNLDAYRGAEVDGEPFPSLLFRTVLNANPGGLFAIDEEPDLNQGIDTVTAVDERTVEVTMHQPWGDFDAYLFTAGRVGIVAPEQLRAGEDCDTTMIGTGPFVHSNPPEVREPRLERNESYWREDSEGRQLPYLDAIQFVAQPVADQRLSGIQGGQFDLTHLEQGDIISRAVDLADGGQLFAHVQEPGFREVRYFLLNNGKAPFDNEDARKALYLAGDIPLITELRNDGMFTVATGLFDERVGGYLEPGDDDLPDVSDRDAALEEAREHVASYEAETGQSLAFEALTTNDPANTAALELLAENLGEAGIDMSISAPVLQSEIINRAVGGALGTALEDAPALFFWRNHSGAGPCSAQYFWFYSGYPTNFAIIDDPEVDELLDAARATTDVDERDEHCRQLNLLMNERMSNAWAWWVDWTIVSGTDVSGVWGPDLPDGSGPPENIAGFHRLEGIWLDG